MRNVSFVLLALLICVVAGCGSDRPTTVPVTGFVTVKGKPLPDAGVLFAPVAGGRPTTGKTNAEGKFTLELFDDRPGAVEGEYQVGVSAQKVSGANVGADGLEAPGEKPAKIEVQWLAPERYADPQTSGLKVTVKAGMEPVKLDLDDK